MAKHVFTLQHTSHCSEVNLTLSAPPPQSSQLLTSQSQLLCRTTNWTTFSESQSRRPHQQRRRRKRRRLRSLLHRLKRKLWERIQKEEEFKWEEADVLLHADDHNAPVKCTYRSLVYQVQQNWSQRFRKRTVDAWYQAVRRWCKRNRLSLRKPTRTTRTNPKVKNTFTSPSLLLPFASFVRRSELQSQKATSSQSKLRTLTRRQSSRLQTWFALCTFSVRGAFPEDWTTREQSST